ncbi:hypothetical protein C8R48DRAFT_680061 [Suillus tomentosus]|nr:hypothetical protein C8R48DRAFT_680061 [Suillus tomentosus]
MARTKIWSTGGSASTSVEALYFGCPTSNVRDCRCPQCGNKFIKVPDSDIDIVQCPTVSFIYLACHSKATLKSPAPFYGFYNGGLPSQGDKEVLPSFLHLNGRYEMASSSIMAARPITFIHFIFSGEDPICTLVSIIYCGWLYASQATKENGSSLEYVTMTVSYMLTTILSAYLMVLKNAHIIFLLMLAVLHFEFASTIVFTAKHFQPLVTSNFFLVFAELVLVEQLYLECTTFACAHPQTQPWGIEVPAQCPQCGTTKSWSKKITLTVHADSHQSAATSNSSMTRYVYSCKYFNCGTAHKLTPHKFIIERPLGFMVNSARTTKCRWFQVSSTFHSPPSLTKGKHKSQVDTFRGPLYVTITSLSLMRTIERLRTIYYVLNKRETSLARDKWNKEDAPPESQAMYHKRNLKNNLDAFLQEVCRTMGCYIVMLVSHKKPGEMSLGVCIHKYEPLACKKAFTDQSHVRLIHTRAHLGTPYLHSRASSYVFVLPSVHSSHVLTDLLDLSLNVLGVPLLRARTFSNLPLTRLRAHYLLAPSKREFYPCDDEDKDEDQEEEDKPSLPEIVLDKEGFRQLPS